MGEFRSLATEKPELVKEWHPTKNGDLSPFDVSYGSGKKVWWICSKGHEWEAVICNRVIGRGCPVCTGKRTLVGYNDLFTLRPDIAKQWHTTKNNNLTPQDVTVKSNKKVWWKCEQGHEWQAIVADRTSGKGCPICAGKKTLAGFNDLATLYPEIAKQWNFLKNGELNPQNVTAGSNKNVWWKCRKGHEWRANIVDRVNGNGCPYCSGRFAIEGENDLSSLFPSLVNEWDFEKNGSLYPQNVKPKSNKKVWWKCEQGHSWQATVLDRVNGSGCPRCQSESKTSFPEQAILYYLSKFFQAENRYKLDKKEIDIYLPQYKIGIEYDGLYFHNSPESEKREKAKKAALNAKGVRLIRIKESNVNERNIDDVIYYTPSHDYTNLNNTIKVLFILIDDIAGTAYANKVSIDIVRDRIEIYEKYKQIIKENSLATKCPEIASEWNYPRNGTLIPKMFSFASSQRVWWKCDKGHEWEAIISNRTTQGIGCPFCAGKKVLVGFNDLATVNPIIASQWHPTKNGLLTPNDVTLNSNKKVWWICAKGHSYGMTVKNKALGLGCPYCYGRYTIKGENDLATLYPDIAKQWNYNKNGDLTPQDVKPKSNKKVWWICDKGHEWQASIKNRVNGTGCPICRKERK